MNATPDFTVTLLISTYNKPAYLRQTLLSLGRQTRMPDEVVIADDGSTDETRELIEEMRQQLPVPIKHIWHPDNGFRKCEILNKSLVQASGDYIVQTDGDIIMERHFIADHLAMAESGYFVCGSRVMLPQNMTGKIISGELGSPCLRKAGIAFWFNGLRIGWLRRYLTKRYDKQDRCIRGCNTAFWLQDVITANGFNEDMTGWGDEDIEIALRMKNNGIRKKMLKMGGVAYHLWHPLSSRERLSINHGIFLRTQAERLSKCKNGIDKYLKNNQ